MAATLAVFPPPLTPPPLPRWRARGPAVAACAAVVAVPLLLWALTGSPRSNTTTAKLLVGNPYYRGAALVEAVRANLGVFFFTLLDGKIWSAEFLPRGGWPVAMAGLGAVAVLGERTRSRWRAAAILLVALTMLAPCAVPHVPLEPPALPVAVRHPDGSWASRALALRLAGDLAARVPAAVALCSRRRGCSAARSPGCSHVEDRRHDRRRRAVRERDRPAAGRAGTVGERGAAGRRAHRRERHRGDRVLRRSPRRSTSSV